MVSLKTPSYYLNKIIDDIKFVIKNTKDISLFEFDEDEVLNSAVCFKFTQISENVKKLPSSLIESYPNIPWQKISGLRNKIVHDYGSVQMDIIFDTAKNDLPILLKNLENLINNNL